MKIHKSYRIFFGLICLTLMLVLTIGTIQASPTQQPETDFTDIDAYVTNQVNNLGIPGLALGIVQDGQIAHLQGFGVADSSGRAVTPQTPFYLASLTKSFTALAVMQLVESGQIDLQRPVQEYLPWFELADKEASDKITVRNLLNHTTGISRADGDRDWKAQQGSEEMASGLKTVQVTGLVGTTYEYSNLNYIIAGWIVEQVSGQPYADYVTEYIFKPLDMRHSYAARTPALADGLAEGHRYVFAYPFVTKADGRFGLASGGLIASVEDMSHYAIAHLNSGRYGDTSILSPQGIAELHAPAIPVGVNEHYGMGWVVGTLNGAHFLGHSGALSNFRTSILLLPETGSGVILLANANGFEQIFQIDELSKHVAGMLVGKPPTPVSVPLHVRFLYWTLLLIPFIQIIGIAYGWRRWRNQGIGRILLTVVLYCGVALLWLFGVPQLIGFPIWPDMHRAYPEMFYGLITGATLGIGWSVLFTTMTLRARRAE